jgi:hypothetical protein
MKNLTAKQIEQVKALKHYPLPRFHGNRKRLGDLLVADVVEIISKRFGRDVRKRSFEKPTPVQVTRQCIAESLSAKGTPYFKVMIEGSTGIYYCCPYHGHRDYNKSRLFDRTPETLRLMRLFNAIVNK